MKIERRPPSGWLLLVGLWATSVLGCGPADGLPRPQGAEGGAPRFAPRAVPSGWPYGESPVFERLEPHDDAPRVDVVGPWVLAPWALPPDGPFVVIGGPFALRAEVDGPILGVGRTADGEVAQLLAIDRDFARIVCVSPKYRAALQVRRDALLPVTTERVRLAPEGCAASIGFFFHVGVPIVPGPLSSDGTFFHEVSLDGFTVSGQMSAGGLGESYREVERPAQTGRPFALRSPIILRAPFGAPLALGSPRFTPNVHVVGQSSGHAKVVIPYGTGDLIGWTPLENLQRPAEFGTGGGVLVEGSRLHRARLTVPRGTTFGPTGRAPIGVFTELTDPVFCSAGCGTTAPMLSLELCGAEVELRATHRL